jgi:hypothetical protein
MEYPIGYSYKLTRRSTTGFVVFCAGGPIAWQSKLQTTLSTSSMQSEYQAMYAGMQERVWLRGVLGEIGLTQCEPTPFFLHSQSAEDLAMNSVYHKRRNATDRRSLPSELEPRLQCSSWCRPRGQLWSSMCWIAVLDVLLC